MLRQRMGFLLLLATLVAGNTWAASHPAPLPGWQAGVAAADKGNRPLVVVALGDANTELPTYAVALRTLLQESYGVRGLGYYTLGKRGIDLPGAPRIAYYGKWSMADMTSEPPPARPWLAPDGMWTTTEDPNALLTVGQNFPSLVHLHYQVGPDLGSLTVSSGETELSRINCQAPAPGSATATFTAQNFQISKITGKVMLFGFTAERTPMTGGALVQQLGNARAGTRHFAEIDAQAYEQFFAVTKPDLILVMLGSNDLSAGVDVPLYRQALDGVLGKIQRAAPHTDVLVISPAGSALDRKGLAGDYAQAARDAAQQQHCAFWDMYAFVGERWKMWDALGLTVNTVNFTPTGGHLIAMQLLKQLGFDVTDPRHYPVLR